MALFGIAMKKDEETLSEYITRITRDIVCAEIADEEAKNNHPNVEWEKDGRHVKWMKLLNAKRKIFYEDLIRNGICEEAANALAYRVHGFDAHANTLRIYCEDSWSHREKIKKLQDKIEKGPE